MAPVLFHSRREKPYGVFSNFSAHPIWIAGKRYGTVEHWYHAAKTATVAEHEWIRAAPTPEEAKRRGRTIRPIPEWPNERLVSMYRGVLAKCRQHPLVGDVLLETRDAPIHEAVDDPFWGANNGGEDWLGRVLVWVRSQLRFLGTFDPSPLFELIRSTPLLRYQMAAAIRQTRNGGEAWLVHLVRCKADSKPATILANILETKLLKASRQLNGQSCVCFSGLTRQPLEDKVFGAEAALRRLCGAYEYSPFGLAVKFDFAREYGFQPALALDPGLAKDLPPSSGFLAGIYASGERQDHTHEDEWRYPTDLEIREGPFAVVLPDDSGQGLQMLGLWDHSVEGLLKRLRCGSLHAAHRKGQSCAS